MLCWLFQSHKSVQLLTMFDQTDKVCKTLFLLNCLYQRTYLEFILVLLHACMHAFVRIVYLRDGSTPK